jgi:hypothetical protein
MATGLHSREEAAELIRKGLTAERIGRWPQKVLPQFMLDDLADQELECQGIRPGHRLYAQRRRSVLEEITQPFATIELAWGRIIARYEEGEDPPAFAMVFALNAPEFSARHKASRISGEFDAEALQFAVGKVIETKFADIERFGAELTDGGIAGELLKFVVLDTRRKDFHALGESLADFVEHYDMAAMLADSAVVIDGNEASARRYVAHGWVV